jgi:hypothetical protein
MTIFYEHPTLGTMEFPNGTPREVMVNKVVEREAAEGKQYGSFETFGDQAGRSFTSSIRGIKDFAGVQKNPREEFDDQVAEYRSRIQMEQNPVSSVLGMLGGGILDPITIPAFALKPLTFASKVGTYASRGAAQGFFGGALEPVYEQYGDSTVANMFAGTVLGSGLGAGIGKLLTKSTDKVAKAVDEVDSSAPVKTESVNIEQIFNAPVRTVEQSNAKILKELELEAKGAPSKESLVTLNKTLKAEKAQSFQLGNILAKLQGDGSKPTLGNRNASRVMEARAVESNAKIKKLELDLASATTLRKAVTNFENAKLGKFSKIEGYADRLKQSSVPLPRTPIAQAVQGQPPAPPSILSSKPSLARKLGLGLDTPRFLDRNDTAGAQRVNQDPFVRQQFMPRSKEDSTRRLVEGKISGDNKETIVPIKLSSSSQEAIDTVNRKVNKGEEITPDDFNKYDKAQREQTTLDEYSDTVAQIARSRGLDTYAARFGSSGRYTFENIEKSASKFLKDEDIDNLDDMVRYILANPEKIFNAAELTGMRDLLSEVDQKLLDFSMLTKHTDGMSDAEIALLHNDIDVFYGIQAWFKGQGSKVAGVMTARKKLQQDIANNREIKQLFAGVEC